jgi:HSP20 family molecular chaperone IbpA
MIITQLHSTNRTSDHSEFFSADWNDDTTVCESCHGSGEVFVGSRSEGRATLKTCSDCEGTGFTMALKVPRTSVVESAGWLIIDMEIPGVVARDLDMEIDGSRVKVRTLPRIDAPDSPVRITRKSMPKPMERVIELPHPVDLDRSGAIRATLLDGVLRMVLPILGTGRRSTSVEDISTN